MSVLLRCLQRACPGFVMFLFLACALPSAHSADSFDPGKASGEEIQAYRDGYAPAEFPTPARLWSYADVAVLTLLLLTGMWLVLTRRPARWLSIHLIISLLYLGLFRGGCICPVGATANVALGIAHPELIGLTTLCLFLAPLAVALIAGRVFCGTVCPLGAVQSLVPQRFARALPQWLHRLLLAAAAAILVLTVWAALGELGFLPCRIDPFTPLFFQGHALVQKALSMVTGSYAEPGWIRAASLSAWLLLAGTLIFSLFIPRAFCRYACPYGVLLGLFSLVAWRRREIDPAQCVHCQRCAKTCPVQAISVDVNSSVPRVSAYQCIQCGRCHDLCKRDAVH